MATFPERLKQLRQIKSVTQKDMATLLGLKNDRTYRQYETGEIDPSTVKLQILADFFNVSTDYLLGRSDDPTRY